MPTACIGLGSNLGDRLRRMEEALRRLSARSGVSVTGVSPAYETDPVGVLDQPRFLNAAATVECFLPPDELLRALLETEAEMGRVRTRKWGPRPIDLDLLLYGDAVVSQPDLVVPHPLLAERAFVLAPLCDLKGDLIHPVLGKSLRELYQTLCGGEPLKPVGQLDCKINDP